MFFAHPASLPKGHRSPLTLRYRFLNNHGVGSFKIPSVLYYDHDGSFRGVKGTLNNDEAEDLHEVQR